MLSKRATGVKMPRKKNAKGNRIKEKLSKIGCAVFLIGFIAQIILFFITKNKHYYSPALFLIFLSLIFTIPKAWEDYKWAEKHKDTIVDSATYGFYKVLLGTIAFLFLSIWILLS